MLIMILTVLRAILALGKLPQTFLAFINPLLIMSIHYFLAKRHSHVKSAARRDPTKIVWWQVQHYTLLKTLWQKEKMLLTSIFTFTQIILFPLKDKLMFWVTLNLSSANALSLDKAEILSLTKQTWPWQVPLKYGLSKQSGKRSICY